jgi:hypothetical protein
VHHYVIEGMHFSGARRTPWMPTGTAESAGIGAWDSGEASEIRNCYFADFEKDGILLVRGTPVLITACSMLTCQSKLKGNNRITDRSNYGKSITW